MENRKYKYFVGVGGTPENTWREFDDYDEARDHCLELAIVMAEEQGIDSDDIDTWGEDNPVVGAGACPSNDEGGYWPVVSIKE